MRGWARPPHLHKPQPQKQQAWPICIHTALKLESSWNKLWCNGDVWHHTVHCSCKFILYLRSRDSDSYFLLCLCASELTVCCILCLLRWPRFIHTDIFRVNSCSAPPTHLPVSHPGLAHAHSNSQSSLAPPTLIPSVNRAPPTHAHTKGQSC